MTATTATLDRRNNIAEQVPLDKLIRDTCQVLATLGVRPGPSKVARLVRRYVDRVQYTGYDYAKWIANEVALDAEQRARAAWGLRDHFGVLDPTGQRAARTADRDLRLGEAWHE